MLRAALALVVTAVILAAPRSAAACSCDARERSPEAIRRAAAAADAVFEGRVIGRVRVDGPPYERDVPGFEREWQAAFAVQRSWTGAPGRRVVVRTPPDLPGCGISFHAGTRHLVFAYRRRDGQLEADACSLTTRLRDADELLAALGDAEPPRLDARGCAVVDRPGPLALWTLLALRRRPRRPGAPADASSSSRSSTRSPCGNAAKSRADDELAQIIDIPGAQARSKTTPIRAKTAPYPARRGGCTKQT
ncbi:hypothetical protein [Nannocystis punicea]|uniref:Tissue inhibitor of metalloproteinase n=1 Tax=Nannocystis punicea TaxID=2995304 RepID=A0ABY7H9S5_9BACT|nr:hypothetical protein [Nannocystis poenicansa]WAS95794.1 hypothetical protein O0S08_06490 [Nannocystis poenicansa]